ncbi:hypothetical protein GWK47_029831 [Chionoecetes opilio]|uniref:Uncharacterized protein n=1 Tax=Chionoecetes opilio TaxID=41210 RepID=A0A8J5D516_CHIOP|nr:hypothetical protein GWK47_029831 [Chionoecetes opilio]
MASKHRTGEDKARTFTKIEQGFSVIRIAAEFHEKSTQALYTTVWLVQVQSGQWRGDNNESWHMAYHGTRPGAVRRMLDKGELLFPGAVGVRELTEAVQVNRECRVPKCKQYDR